MIGKKTKGQKCIMETEVFQILYDSLFRKWVDWCNQQHSDPVSGPISEVVNFLAHLFKEGYQYCSLNAYHSAISSAMEFCNYGHGIRTI